MPEELKVTAEPTPEPTPEEANRLRLQLERDRAMWEAAGVSENAEAVKARLAELPEPEVTEEAVEEVVPESNDTDTGPYEDRTVEQLKTLLESKGLPTSGNKDELIARLREG
jgi:SAP domain